MERSSDSVTHTFSLQSLSATTSSAARTSSMTTQPARNSGPSSHSGSNNGAVLWMGDVSTGHQNLISSDNVGLQVDPQMDDDSVRKSFADMNEPVDYVRVMRPKEGSSFGYELPFCCYLHIVTFRFRDAVLPVMRLSALETKPLLSGSSLI